MSHRPTSTIHFALSCALLALGACGDDSTPGTGTGSTTGGDTTTSGSPTTTMDSLDSSGGPPPGTSSSGDPTTTSVDTTMGPADSSGGSSSGGGMAECTGMSFDMLTSTNNDMVTNLDVSGIVSCNQDITITATGGTVCATDDGAGGYFYTVETVTLEDVPPVTCGLAQVGISNMSIVNTGDYMEVVVDQAGGTATGNQSIQVLGDVEGTAIGNPIMAPLMDFTGVLPEGDVAFGAGDTTVTYADTMTVVATAMPEVAPGIAVTVTLTGLDGSLTFAM